MKKMLMLALALGLTTTGVSMAQAADNENSGSVTSDTSHNPITGTDKTVKTTKRKMKTKGGATEDMKVKETTKVHKDGKVEKSVDASADSENK